MQLRLSQLRRVAERTADRERADEMLKRELQRVFGPSFVAKGRTAQVARAANERLDVLEGTGGFSRLGIGTTSLLRASEHHSAEVRRLAARLLPERFIRKFSCDFDANVRHAAAARLPVETLFEMARRDPSDSVIRGLIRQKHRGLIAEKKEADAPQEIDTEAELSDTYYESLAERLLQDHGRQLEFGWEIAAVRQLARSMRASSGIVIDEERLLSLLDELINERDDATLEAPDRSLREAFARSDRRVRNSQDAIPLIGDDETDQARLIERAGSAAPTFMRDVELLFAIMESAAPAGLRRHLMREGVAGRIAVPSFGRTPGGATLRAVDERILDRYVKRWNERATGRGDLVRISWSPSSTEGSIRFTAEAV